MPPDTLYVTTHLHTDGPIPGPHSLLTLTSEAHDTDGVLIGTFTRNVRELPGATLHPVALEQWRNRAEDWLTTRRASRPPAPVMNDYVRWIEKLPGPPTFVADPDEYLFLFWYLQRFARQWPFARTSTESELRNRLPEPTCSLSGCRAELARTS